MAGTVHELNNSELAEKIKQEAAEAAEELTETAGLKPGSIVVIGCSTSEVLGKNMGTWSVPEAGQAVYEGLSSVFDRKGIFIAAQCCEHLNRAVVIERSALPLHAEPVNAVPQPKAGGSFAAACFRAFKDPVVLEEIKADAGMDIGGTLIGMHLKRVAVPVKLTRRTVGEAILICARTRPKYIGGERTVYDESLR